MEGPVVPQVAPELYRYTVGPVYRNDPSCPHGGVVPYHGVPDVVPQYRGGVPEYWVVLKYDYFVAPHPPLQMSVGGVYERGVPREYPGGGVVLEYHRVGEAVASHRDLSVYPMEGRGPPYRLDGKIFSDGPDLGPVTTFMLLELFQEGELQPYRTQRPTPPPPPSPEHIPHRKHLWSTRPSNPPSPSHPTP